MTTTPALKIEHCRSCQAEIVWLRHAATGKAAPIDAAPTDDGNILIDRARGTYSIVVAAARSNFPGLLYKNHFSTCPDRQT